MTYLGMCCDEIRISIFFTKLLKNSVKIGYFGFRQFTLFGQSSISMVTWKVRSIFPASYSDSPTKHTITAMWPTTLAKGGKPPSYTTHPCIVSKSLHNGSANMWQRQQTSRPMVSADILCKNTLDVIPIYERCINSTLVHKHPLMLF